MAVTVRIPTPLRTLTGGADEVSADGGTVAEVIENLEANHPGMKDRLCDEKGVRRFVNIYANDEDIRFLDNLETVAQRGRHTEHRSGHRGRGLALSLDAAAGRRYARQLLLGEIGESGLERLLEAAVSPRSGWRCGRVCCGGGISTTGGLR